MLKIISQKNLKIIHINVNSIITIIRRFDLQKFINMHNPDIVFLNETKLNKKDKLMVFNYNIIRNYRLYSKQGGEERFL